MEGKIMNQFDSLTRALLNDQELMAQLNDYHLTEEERNNLILQILRKADQKKKEPKYLNLIQTLPNDYISFDIETTGFSYTDKMTQIAAVKYINRQPIEEFTTYVNTEGLFIPANITRLTGITNQETDTAPTLRIATSLFMDFIEDFQLIGHNINSFEIPRFRKWADIDLKPRVAIDTYNLAKIVPLNIENYKLETLKEFYNIDLESHNALSDSKTTAIVFENIRNLKFDHF
ncbi:hypothetical protein ESZ54_10520 [Vagococcus silagei]|uniref:DNA polymerase III polC-type n=2 Tax=Vagococcus silagei TaxID=2508885 RepID=A0A4S3B6V1_9ENTE|nr:hypothetical protein ESZ54_10520 [Vagococcus silagei]